LFRRQKNQRATMKAMSAIAPPTVPPTMAPRLGAAAGASVGDGDAELVLEGAGVLVDKEVGVGEGVTASADTVGVLVANAPWPVSIGVAPIVATVVTNLAEALNELKASWLGGLITPTIPTLQWNTGFDTAQKYQMGAETLVMIRFHTWRGAELLGPNPK